MSVTSSVHALAKFLCDTESERNVSWPDGCFCFCKDTKKLYILNGGVFVLIGTPWTYAKLAADFSTTLATLSDVTGLAFTPVASTSYVFEARLMLRTATATVNPRPGIAWASGLADGVAELRMAQLATTQLIAFGNIAAAVQLPVGGLVNTTQSWPAFVNGIAIAGVSPSGTVKVQIASETAGTSVTVKTGSFLRYRVM